MKGPTSMHKCNNDKCPCYDNGKCTKIVIELDTTGKCIEIFEYIAEVSPTSISVSELAKTVNLLIRTHNRKKI